MNDIDPPADTQAQSETKRRSPSGEALHGQVAIVTGGSSGIGAAIAVALARAGATVVVDHRPKDRSAEEAEAIVAAIEKSGGTANAFAADVTDEAQVDHLVADTVARYGGLDIMVANAGVESPARIQDMELEDWRKVIDVNLTGAFLCARAAARAFLAREPRPEVSKAAGKIIFTSSVHEFIPWAFQSNYAASKGGVMMLMKSLAQELAPSRIRVNSIAPGAVRTSINTAAWQTEDALGELLKLVPYDRIGEPEDIGRAAAWLASDAADYVVGTTLVVDGGMSLYPSFRGAG